MMTTMFSHELNFPEIWPVVTKIAWNIFDGAKNKQVWSRCTVACTSSTQKERYYRAVVYHPVSLATKLYQEQNHGMYWYTRKKRRGKKKNTKKEKKGKYTEKKENKKKEKTEKKMRPDGRQNKKRVHRQQRKEQSYVQRLGQGRHKGHKKRTETDRQRCARSITFMLLRLDASCCVCASGKPNATTTKGRTPQPKANPTREKWG